MKLEDRRARSWEYPTLVGDTMLFAVPIGAISAALLMNVLMVTGLGGLGFAIGAVAAPAGALLLALVLRGEAINSTAYVDIGLSTLVASLVVGAAYGVVVVTKADQSAAFEPLMLVILALEILAVLGPVVDAVADLARKRAHRVLDTIRLVAAAFVVVGVAFFSGNPDFGELIVVVIPLAGAGAIAGRAYDLFEGIRHRREAGDSPIPLAGA